MNTENYNLDTRQKNNLHLPQANLTIYQKGAYYSGIKMFNNLPLEIKNVADNQKKIKTALKKFLYTYSFYTLEEYFSQLWIMYCITKIFNIVAFWFKIVWYALDKHPWIVVSFT